MFSFGLTICCYGVDVEAFYSGTTAVDGLLLFMRYDLLYGCGSMTLTFFESFLDLFDVLLVAILCWG
jgi:hypothetical protein